MNTLRLWGALLLSPFGAVLGLLDWLYGRLMTSDETLREKGSR